MMEKPRVLLVDDDKHILDLLKVTFIKEEIPNNFSATNGKEAINLCERINPHVIVLDVMLPDINGFEVCIKLRNITDVPILFLTAKGTDLDKLSGFNYGGDDYITKPFNPLEVVARVKVHLKRQNQAQVIQAPKESVWDYGRFKLNEQTGQLLVEKVEVICPAKEFQLLVYLCRHPNLIFSKHQLYERIWGSESFGDLHTVMVHIRRLREKIEIDPSNPQYLVTVRGLGYKLIKPSEGSE